MLALAVYCWASELGQVEPDLNLDLPWCLTQLGHLLSYIESVM